MECYDWSVTEGQVTENALEIGEAVFFKPDDVSDHRKTRWSRREFVGRGEEDEFYEDGEGERDDGEEDDGGDLHCCWHLLLQIMAKEGKE